MTWIKTLGPDDDSDVRSVYEYRMRSHGYWPNVIASQTLKPKTLRALMDFQDQLTFGGSSLGRRREELISFYVSSLNDCHYWTTSHGEFLRKNIDQAADETRTGAQVRQIRENFYGADLTEQEMAMLEFVGKMTVDSKSMTAEDTQRLRDHGFDEVQLLEIVQLTGWFNYMTRVADALGVEVEEWRQGWHDYLFGKAEQPVLLPPPRSHPDRWGRRTAAYLAQQRGDGVPSDFDTEALQDSLCCLLGGLLSREAGPIEEAARQIVLRVR